MTSDQNLHKIYNELIRRIQHIGIALSGQKFYMICIDEQYDLKRTDTPSVGEAEDAFMRWNCAILTAFRRQEGLTAEENYEHNIKRNEQLKSMLSKQNMRFRGVRGCYREINWEKPNEEICFFVTNTDTGDSKSGDILDFFSKIYRLAEHFEQDCFLFTFPGQNRVAFLIATNDDGRGYFRSDIKFAGPLFTYVPDIGDWTDCSDGRISFKLKGMIQKGGTGNKKITIGEGDIFDINAERYTPDGIVILHEKSQTDLKNMCKTFDGAIPLVECTFAKKYPTADDIRSKVCMSLNKIIALGCKRIGFHCSVALDGSYIEGAREAYYAVQNWAKRYDRRLERIIIVDIFGDYSKAMNSL